ncbi:MAG: IS1634 family transposase [Tannerellaceae bacterium]|jgi:transposase|nr:IS1634 family transposase [Tannerellaceae bacterium]
MFIRLQKSPTSKRIQVHLVEGYRNEKGQPRQRILKNYGELSELSAQDPNILEKLKAEAGRLTRQHKESRVMLEVDTLRARNEGEHTLNYGHFFLESIYRGLRIPSFFRKELKKKDFSYDLDAIMRLLVFSRVLMPDSKQATFEAKDRFFCDFTFEKHDVYRALGVLAELCDELQLHMHKRISQVYGREARLVFYDVTNYYFETDLGDGFREKGMSKEHRQDPVVQMGLLIDAKGIPITFRLFSGNTHDSRTLIPVLKELKTKYGLARIVIVADKGLNSGANLGYMENNSDGYIVSQKVRGSVAPEILRQITDPDGYNWNDNGKFAYKSFLRTVSHEKGKKTEEKVVCFWSSAHAARESHKRGDLLPAVEDMLRHPGKYEAANKYGRKRYVKEMLTTPEGEAAGKRLSFDEERYQADAALDGYYCILTSEKEMDDLTIIEHYHGLSRIEESFRVIKSELEGRPVYVWTQSHIKAHFLICFIALTLVRLIQMRSNYTISAKALAKALNSAQCTPLEKGIFVVDETDTAYKAIETAFGVSLTNRYAPIELIKAYRRQIMANS